MFSGRDLVSAAKGGGDEIYGSILMGLLVGKLTLGQVAGS